MEEELLNKETEFNKRELGFIQEDIRSKYPLNNSNTPTIDPIDQLLGEPVKSLNDYSDVKFTDTYTELSNGDYISKFDDYSVINLNQEQRQAELQGTGNKWGNGLTKFLGKTITSVAGGTVGTVYGAIEGIKQGSFRATYDNQFTDWLDDLNTKMDYNLPNYYTEQEKEQGFIEGMGSANFWANDVLGGASFTAGAIVSEGIWTAATGGASLATTTARLGGRSAKIFGKGSKMLGAINKVKKTVAAPVKNTYSTAKLPTELATRFGQAGELANTARFTYTSAGYEAGVEARHYIKETTDNFQRDFEEKNGRKPSLEEERDFRKTLTDNANSLYTFNLALVGSSNLAIVGKMFDIKSPIKAPNKWINRNVFGVGVKETEKGAVKEIEATALQKVLGKTYSLAKAPLVEGFYEEGGQSVGSNVAKIYAQASYDPKYTDSSLDMSAAMSEALGETYGTKEGWKEVGIGALIGLFTGTGVNLASGQGLFGDYTAEQKKAKQEAVYRNYYSPNKFIETLKTANRIQTATDAQDKAQARYDQTGAELARKSAMISQIAHSYNFDYMKEDADKIRIAIENMDNQEIMQEYGFETEQQAIDLKAQMVSEYSATQSEYKKYRDFAEYYVGNSLTKQEKEIANSDVETIKEAVAYELTLGSEASNFASEILDSIKQEIASTYTEAGSKIESALDLQDILSSASKEARINFNNTRKKLAKAKRDLAKLEKQRLKIEAPGRKPEDVANELNTLTNKIAEAQEQMVSYERELEGTLSALVLSNPYRKSDQPFITVEQISEVDENMKGLKDLVEEYKKSDAQKGYKLEKMLEEYGKAKSAFTRYADLSRQLSDPKLGLVGKRNIISEVVGNKDVNELTIETLKGLQQSSKNTVEEKVAVAATGEQAVKDVLEGETITTEEYNEFVDKGVVPQNVLNSIATKIKGQQKLTTKEEAVYRAKATEIENLLQQNTPKTGMTQPSSEIQRTINLNSYLLDYVGEEQNAEKPSEQEVEEYQNLIEKANQIKGAKNLDDILTRTPKNYRQGENRMSKEEVQKLQDLNQKMSDWRLFEGFTNEEGISLKDLIEQQLSSQQEVQNDSVNDTLTDDDITSISNPKNLIEGKEAPRNESIAQVYETVKVQKTKVGLNISHLKLSSIVSKLNNVSKIVMFTPTEVDGNGVVKEWDSKEITPSELRESQSTKGLQFAVVSGGVEYNFQIKGGGIIAIADEQITPILEATGYRVFKHPLTKKTTYADLYYENPSTGEQSQVKSDFVLNDSNVQRKEYTPQEVYNLDTNSRVYFQMNPLDSYNQQLKEKLEEGTITEEEFLNQVKVYVVTGDNKILGDIKSAEGTENANPTFMEIRRRAAKALQETTGDTTVEIEMASQISHVFLGSPNITMENDGSGYVRPVENTLTEESLEAVVDYGVTREDGTLQLKGETSDVRRDFVADLPNTPVVVFKVGKYNVAYPLSLIKTEGTLLKQADSILASNQNMAQKTTAINNLMAQNGISPSNYNLYYNTSEDNNMWTDEGNVSETLAKALDAMSQVESKPDVLESWFKDSHTKESLVSEVTITIDLADKPLSSPKPVIDFNNTQEVTTEDWYSSYLSTNELSNEKALEIANAIAFNSPLTANEYDVSDNEKVKEALEAIYALSNTSKKQSKTQKSKKC